MVELRSLGTLAITVRDRVRVEGIPQGTRVVGEAAECRWEGDRVRAVQQGSAGSDWLTIDGDVGVIDARMVLRTDDDALIFVRYGGRARYSGGEPVGFVTAPTFETADPRYHWLNSVQAIGVGRRVGFDLVYDLYEVLDGTGPAT